MGRAETSQPHSAAERRAADTALTLSVEALAAADVGERPVDRLGDGVREARESLNLPRESLEASDELAAVVAAGFAPDGKWLFDIGARRHP